MNRTYELPSTTTRAPLAAGFIFPALLAALCGGLVLRVLLGVACGAN